MRRILFIGVLALFGTAISGLPQSTTQIHPRVNYSRRVEVNAKTIQRLAPGKTYVVDLTQRGVKYEFNHQAGKIDLSRVTVRTAQGEIAIDSFLEKGFLKGKLARVKYTSEVFSLRTRPPGRPQSPPTLSSIIQCDAQICSCQGSLGTRGDCDYLLIFSTLCGDVIFCVIDPISRQEICSCARRP